MRGNQSCCCSDHVQDAGLSISSHQTISYDMSVYHSLDLVHTQLNIPSPAFRVHPQQTALPSLQPSLTINELLPILLNLLLISTCCRLACPDQRKDVAKVCHIRSRHFAALVCHGCFEVVYTGPVDGSLYAVEWRLSGDGVWVFKGVDGPA